MSLSTVQPADPQIPTPTPDQQDPKPQKDLEPTLPTAQTKKYLHRISLHPTLTPYRRRVYRTLLSVPPGRWTTYSAMATYLGSSARAVGNAMRTNPFAPEVPCHRVLAADGSLGGYKGEWKVDGHKAGGGFCEEKRLRLEEEGVVFLDGKVRGVCFKEFVDLGANDANNICGIIYYTHTDKQPGPNPWGGGGDIPSPLPTTAAYNLTDTGEDEPASTLLPIISTQLSLNATDFFYNEALSATASLNNYSIHLWHLNGTSIQGNWAQPTLRNSSTAATTNKNAIVSIPQTNTWVLVVIEMTMNIAHLIHLHGHHFRVVGQGYRFWNGFTSSSTSTSRDRGTGLNLNFAAGALPKCDTQLLPGIGYIVLAFRSDNPSAWFMHRHIEWHLDQGVALWFVEKGEDIEELFGGVDVDGARDWRGFVNVLKRNCRT
ncbi:hypothetical protein N7471_008315 [Penicillium samsonianum]|uniref:uncharacterized protein n=1 Tax=Penicillium samsonianum TaxID=1882272 RepID=UPI00254741E9|nr:uncharacterized protein N7471_008315 [Penicillium samsonianum]KAJ6133100.1 hypothetical protein N7471_008315 [Penicillium samsonianum]